MINHSNVVSVSKKSFGNLLVIDLKKEGNSASFIFDTGATISVINKTTADRFGAKSLDKKIKAGGTSGHEIQVNLSTIKDIKTGDYTLPEVEIMVVEDEILHFGQDDEGHELIIDGFLGWDIISKHRWAYNHDKLEIHFGISKKMNYENCMLDEWDNMPIINVMLDGQKRVFGFDSGHTESIIGSLLYSEYEHLKMTKDSFVGMDGQSIEDVKIVNKIEVELLNSIIILKDIVAVNRNLFPCKRHDISGLLGFDLIEGRHWVLDYQNRYFEIFDVE